MHSTVCINKEVQTDYTWSPIRLNIPKSKQKTPGGWCFSINNVERLWTTVVWLWSSYLLSLLKMDVMAPFGHTIHSGKFIFFWSFCSWVHWKASYYVAFLVTIDEKSSYSSWFFYSVYCLKISLLLVSWYKAFLNFVLTSQTWAKCSKFKINNARSAYIQIENESSFCKVWSPFLKLTISWVNGYIESQNILN